MKVAILGGTRFIGPAIAGILVQHGHKVEVYHRGTTRGLLPEAVQHVIVDRDVPGQVSDALLRSRPDGVIDMCGYRAAHVEEIVRADLQFLNYVYCSSTAVYGQIFKTTPDELTATNPKSAYEIGKIACENLLQIAHQHRGFAMTIARLAHPYGPLEELMYSTGRDSLFIDRMRHGRPIIIPSGGDTRIQAIYVDDAATAFVFMLENPAKCVGKCFNLAHDQILSHDEYFESIARVLSVRLIAEHIPGQWFEQNAQRWSERHRNFDFAAVWHRYECAFDASSLASIGFRCKTDHDFGVAQNIQWLDSRGKIPVSTDQDLEDEAIRVWRKDR